MLAQTRPSYTSVLATAGNSFRSHELRGTKPKFLIALVPTILLFLVARVTLGAPVDLAWQHTQADPIREALFRYLIKTNSTGLRPKAFYLTIWDGKTSQDPSRRIVEDLAGGAVPVKAASKVPHHRNPFWLNGDHILGAQQIVWKSCDGVEVQGSDVCGGKCGNVRTYLVQYHNAHWTVTGHTGATLCY